MPILIESDVEGKICEWADRRGILHSKLNPMNRSGWPDRAFWLPGGRPAILEIKRPDEEPRKLQRYIMNQLLTRGYDVAWVDNAEEGIAWLTARALEAGRKKAARVPKTLR